MGNQQRAERRLEDGAEDRAEHCAGHRAEDGAEDRAGPGTEHSAGDGGREAAVVIATKDRPDDIGRAVESVVASAGIDLEVVVADQSDGPETRELMARWADDARVRYLHRDEPGKTKAMNVAVAATDAPYVLFTDDDCEVPTDWARIMVDTLARDRIGVVFCRIASADHDERAGFIPGFAVDTELTWRSLWRRTTFGLGAGMGVRREVLDQLGGFDEVMGPGARFPSADDGDIEMRALDAGWHSANVNRTEVLHYGFRTWEEGVALARRDFGAVGGYCAKAVRCRVWPISRTILQYLLVIGLTQPLWQAVRGRKRPTGLKRGVYFMQGFIDGFRAPVDRKRLQFIPDEPSGALQQIN